MRQNYVNYLVARVDEPNFMDSKLKSIQDKKLGYLDDAKVNQYCSRKSASSREIRLQMKIISFWDCELGQPCLPFELLYALFLIHNFLRSGAVKCGEVELINK